jgi:hypothetical protein
MEREDRRMDDAMEAQIQRLCQDPRDTALRYLTARTVLALAAERLRQIGDEDALPLIEDELEEDV